MEALTTTTTDGRCADVEASIERACDRIAPAWPLDQLVAVNPYWGWRELPIAEAAGRLAVLSGTSLTMARSWYRHEWTSGRLTKADIEAAAELLGDPAAGRAALDVLTAAAVEGCTVEHPAVERLALVTDVRDGAAPPRPGQTWAAHVIHQISQHCAAHADRSQASWPQAGGAELYRSWLRDPSLVHGVAWRHGRRWVRATLGLLPDNPTEAIAFTLDALGVPPEGHEPYLTALLLSVNGWASWCAHLRWTARLANTEDHTIVELLAIRLVWEWLLRCDDEPHDEPAGRTTGGLDHVGWAASWASLGVRGHEQAGRQQLDWVLQTAVEQAYQRRLAAMLSAVSLAPAQPDAPAPPSRPAPAVQAVFCIDVRSEVLRRALEAVAPDVVTRGFAGFFGLPISYRPVGSDLDRPQLPALLAPSLCAGEGIVGNAADDKVIARLAERRRVRVGRLRRAAAVRHTPSSMFTFVEIAGLLYGPKLLKETVSRRVAPRPVESFGLAEHSYRGLRPRLTLLDEDEAAAAELAARILRAMGLVDGFAPLVLLCGHGAETANNPLAAGLHCGACGGQRGDVNARALAGLLNDPGVRARLTPFGIAIPAGTWFVAGLHTTTTDEVVLFDTELVPASLKGALGELQRWLSEAGRRARGERADRLGIDVARSGPAQLERAMRDRARDWSEVRPEWGLAGNAALIIAPRSRTCGVELAGRVFLHDYDWRLDGDGSVLSLLMTAPMVVANWINLQYYASTVDNARYGSGNKALHNIVGGRIGVFEGNGGDLRTGLALQSLHDGERLQHPPLRLSVLIEAPRAAIEEVIATQSSVEALVTNGWLHLLRIEGPDCGGDTWIERWTADGWRDAVADPTSEQRPAPPAVGL